MDAATRQARSEARIRLAHALQTGHGIDPAEMARVLNLSLPRYLARLRQLKLDAAKPAASPEVAALQRLQAELKRLLEAEELPDKGKAEALMALARAVKTLGELSSETPPPAAVEAGPVGLAQGRDALQRINRRIEELAQKRARELLGGGLDAPADAGGGRGMAAEGA